MKRSRSIHDDIAVKKSKSDENEVPSENTSEPLLEKSAPATDVDNLKEHSESKQESRPIAKPTKRLSTKTSETSEETNASSEVPEQVAEQKTEQKTGQSEQPEQEIEEKPHQKTDEKPKEKPEEKIEEKSGEKSEAKSEKEAETKPEAKPDLNEDKSEDKSEGDGTGKPEVKSQENEISEDKTQPAESKPAAPKPNTGFAGFSSFSKFSSGGGFGSSFKSGFGTGFGSGFGSFASSGSIAKKDGKTNPWAEKPGTNAWATNSDSQKKESDADTKNSTPEAKDDAKRDANQDAFAQVTLEKQDVRTGEEDESTIESVRARLYAVDSEAKAWKERGTGVLKLNTTTQDGEKKFRLVMRLDGVLRVTLNVPLFKSMQLLEGFTNSLHTERFFRFSGIEDGEARQFAVRCPSEETRDQFFQAIKNALGELE